MIGSSNDETNSPHNLLLIDIQVSRICKSFANGSFVNIKFLKTQLSKMIQSGGILGESLVAMPHAMFLAGRKRSIKRGISLALKIATKLAEKATEYYINRGINELNKKFTLSKGSGITLRNNEIKDIMKVIQSLENRGILLKGTTRTITNQKGGFLISFGY